MRMDRPKMYISIAVILGSIIKFWILGCEKVKARDCREIQDNGFSTSGVYTVTPGGTCKELKVYCDMDTDGGGWMLFQRREDGSEDFYRGWEDYQFGFGNVSGEHWLGNFLLYIVLRQGHHELRVALEDWQGNVTYAKYRYFNLSDPVNLYKITVLGYSGNAGDSLTPAVGTTFSTKDKLFPGGPPCASLSYHGAWWYDSTNCDLANLNGRYPNDEQSYPWFRWKYESGNKISLRKTEMKIRRI